MTGASFTLYCVALLVGMVLSWYGAAVKAAEAEAHSGQLEAQLSSRDHVIMQLEQLLAESASQNLVAVAADQQIKELQEALRAAEDRAMALQNGVSDGVSRIAQLDQERAHSDSARQFQDHQTAERIQALEADLEGPLPSTASTVICSAAVDAVLTIVLCSVTVDVVLTTVV